MDLASRQLRPDLHAGLEDRHVRERSGSCLRKDTWHGTRTSGIGRSCKCGQSWQRLIQPFSPEVLMVADVVLCPLMVAPPGAGALEAMSP
jgi:hypothetical protein